MAQAEFTSAEHVKSLGGVPAKGGAFCGADGKKVHEGHAELEDVEKVFRLAAGEKTMA